MNDSILPNQTTNTFHCPVHGPEVEILCWRAFDKENLNLWKRYAVSYREIPFGDVEKINLIERLQETSVSYRNFGVP